MGPIPASTLGRYDRIDVEDGDPHRPRSMAPAAATDVDRGAGRYGDPCHQRRRESDGEAETATPAAKPSWP
jgi:hypothetical protein